LNEKLINSLVYGKDGIGYQKKALFIEKTHHLESFKNVDHFHLYGFPEIQIIIYKCQKITAKRNSNTFFQKLPSPSFAIVINAAHTPPNNKSTSISCNEETRKRRASAFCLLLRTP
jgi:hypothetical protein